MDGDASAPTHRLGRFHRSRDQQFHQQKRSLFKSRCDKKCVFATVTKYHLANLVLPIQSWKLVTEEQQKKYVQQMVQFPAPLGAHADDLKVPVTHLNRLKSNGLAQWQTKGYKLANLVLQSSNSKLDMQRLKVINPTAQFTALIWTDKFVIKSF